MTPAPTTTVSYRPGGTIFAKDVPFSLCLRRRRVRAYVARTARRGWYHSPANDQPKYSGCAASHSATFDAASPLCEIGPTQTVAAPFVSGEEPSSDSDEVHPLAKTATVVNAAPCTSHGVSCGTCGYECDRRRHRGEAAAPAVTAAVGPR